jgi:hypothetical protein
MRWKLHPAYKGFILITLGLMMACYWTGPLSQPTPSTTPLKPSVTATPPASAVETTTAVPTTAVPTTTHPPPTITPTPTAALPPTASYDLHVLFDYQRAYLETDARISFTHLAEEALNELDLVIEANLYPGVFHLLSLVINGAPADNYSLEDNILLIPLETPLTQGNSTEIQVSYTLDLPAIPPPEGYEKPQIFGFTERQVNLVDWYPFLPPYIPGQGWLVHKPWFYGEYLALSTANFLVEIELQNPPENLVIAASALPQINGDTYTYNLDQVRSFAWSASDAFQVFRDTVDGIPVLSYAFPPYYTDGGKAALEYTKQALEHFSHIFGPYAYQSLSVVQADFLDGMEYTGMFYLSKGFYDNYRGTPDSYLTAIAAHETAHQWWFSMVGSDQALEPWLDEAMCTYSERLYFESIHPEALDWWWTYRVQYYQPRGYINGGIYDYRGYLAYRDAVYLNGAVFLEELRQAVGDEAFFAFLKGYAAEKNSGMAIAQDFFSILKLYTSADISGLLETYFGQFP